MDFVPFYKVKNYRDGTMSKQKSSDFMVRYTNKDIMDKLEALHEDQQKTLAQAMKTNGRVSKQEEELKEIKRKSVGFWASNNTIKFTLIVIAILGILISDSRELLVSLIIKAFIGV